MKRYKVEFWTPHRSQSIKWRMQESVLEASSATNRFSSERPEGGGERHIQHCLVVFRREKEQKRHIAYCEGVCKSPEGVWSGEDRKEGERGGLYIHPPAQPLVRVGLQLREENGQLYVEREPVLIRQHLSRSLHQLANVCFWRRSENHPIIIQRRPFSHGHHSLCRRFITQPHYSSSRVLETGGGARRTRSILLTSDVLKKRETIHVPFIF